VLVQQVHQPLVAAFLDIDLEQVAQVVGWARSAQVALLATEAGSVSPWVMMRPGLARCSPGTSARLSSRCEMDLPVGCRVEKNPAVVAHLHMAELRPAPAVDADGGAQATSMSVSPRLCRPTS
jgi:hypothetical protein